MFRGPKPAGAARISSWRIIFCETAERNGWLLNPAVTNAATPRREERVDMFRPVAQRHSFQQGYAVSLESSVEGSQKTECIRCKQIPVVERLVHNIVALPKRFRKT